MQTLGLSNDLEIARVVKSISVILDLKDQAERNINYFARQIKPSQPVIRMIFLKPFMLTFITLSQGNSMESSQRVISLEFVSWKKRRHFILVIVSYKNMEALIGLRVT